MEKFSLSIWFSSFHCITFNEQFIDNSITSFISLDVLFLFFFSAGDISLILCLSVIMTNEPLHGKTNKLTVRPAKTQISLGIHPVWSVFAVRMKKACALSYPLSAQRRLWSDWADAQADLSLRLAHSHFVGFVMSLLKLYFCLLSIAEESQSELKKDPCDLVTCSKFKVCMVNSQGLPLCTCPSVNICEPGRKKNKNRLSGEMVVCGSDGVTYKSRCHMRIANCMNRRRIKRAHKGACTQSDIKTEVEENQNGLIESDPFNESTNQERLKAIERANRKRLKRKRRKEKKRRRERERKEKKEKKERKNKKSRRNRRKRRNNVYPRSYGYYYLLGKKTNWGTNQVRRNRAM